MSVNLPLKLIRYGLISDGVGLKLLLNDTFSSSQCHDIFHNSFLKGNSLKTYLCSRNLLIQHQSFSQMNQLPRTFETSRNNQRLVIPSFSELLY